MAGKRISQLDVISGAAVAADDSFIVFDTSLGVTKRVLRSELATALSTNLIGAGLEADGLGSIKIRPDTTPGSAVLVTGAGLAVGVGNTNAEHVGLRSRNQSAGNAATSVVEVATGAANVSVRFEVLNNDGAPIGRMTAGSALASWQHRAGVHIFYNQAGTTEYGRISSSGFQVGGLIESTANGFRFPDGTTQTTAATSLADATEAVAGRIEIATQAETNLGTDNVRAITPAKLANIAPATVTPVSGDLMLILDASDGGRMKSAPVALGKLVQQVYASTGAVDTTTVGMPYDNSIPLATEGKEFLSVSLTPASVGNTLLVEALVYCACPDNHTFAVFHEAAGVTPTGLAIAAGGRNIVNTAGALFPLTIRHRVTPGSAGLQTFRLRGGPSVSGNTLTLNGENGVRLLGGVLISSLTVSEIAA